MLTFLWIEEKTMLIDMKQCHQGMFEKGECVPIHFGIHILLVFKDKQSQSTI